MTGHSGFKGSWAVLLLEALGAKVFGLSIDIPPNSRHLYYEHSISQRLAMGEDCEFDVSDFPTLTKFLEKYEFDFIFHFAAQAIVSVSMENPVGTFRTNILGVANVVEACRISQPNATVVIVTSDKCYEPNPAALPYTEQHTLGGEDPYSASKAAAELIFKSLVMNYSPAGWPKGIASVRAGNVFGGGDWSPNRLAPDLVRNAELGIPTKLRLPEATRPWTYVLDIIYGYLQLASQMRRELAPSGQSWNFASGEKMTVREFAESLSKELGGRVSTAAAAEFEEVGFLELDSSKARAQLGWAPVFTIREALQFTSKWYGESESRRNLNFFLDPYVELFRNG